MVHAVEKSTICGMEKVNAPFLILHGDADPVVLFEDSETLYDKLTEHGYAADLVHVTNAPHEGNFWSEELLEIIFAFIQKNA